ncbi:MAG: hypothetical protein ACE5KY_04645 [Candidatus Tectimicrobiota bacterium]
MIFGRLIKMIEDHAEELTAKLVKEIKGNKRCAAYEKIDDEELKRRAYAVYKNLGAWLGEKTEEDIKGYFIKLGEQRYQEEIPLSHLVSALTITRNHLRRYIDSEGLLGTSLELYQELELLHSLTVFFDKAIHYSTVGYEACYEEGRPRGVPEKTGWILSR